MNKRTQALLCLLSASMLFSCGSGVETKVAVKKHEKQNQNLALWPQIKSEVKIDESIELKVKELLADMTLEQKVAQMIQPEIRDITPEDMRKYGFGSYLNGGGAFPNNDKHATPEDWIALAEAMYQASIDDSIDGSTIPTMWGTDAVHGHNNVIGATLFPHNIGLGAANNPELIEEIAHITAKEVMVTGIDWVFAPTVATVRDDRWGRTYEGYSEDPDIVKHYAEAVVKGLQGKANQDFLGDDRVISTVKHFIGDGGTVKGDDQGDNQSTEADLFNLHAQGYVGGLTAGAQSVMASFNSWNGEKIHGNHYLLTQALKQRMGFDGFVVGDWNGHGQIKGCDNTNCPQAINAGLDIYMVPTDAWKPLMENTIAQVNNGIIPLSRIDDAVTRILRVKFRAGLFDKPSPAQRKLSGKTSIIGNEAHRIVAQQAVRESLVLLKNKNALLPLSLNQHILVAGDAANNIGKQSGGWTITWQGTNNQNADFPGGSSILEGLKSQVLAAGGTLTFNEKGHYDQKPDVAIIVYGEEPYAEGFGDIDNLVYQRSSKADLALLKGFKAAGIPVVSVFISGRPLLVNAELNASDAFVAAWLPGSEGKAIADVLLRDKHENIQHDFKGKLSFSWPKHPTKTVNRFDENYEPLLPYGFGLTYQDQNILSDNLEEHFELNTNAMENVSLFSGKAIKPWKMILTSGIDAYEIESNSLSAKGITYRTIDKVVQEDAFNLTTDGSAISGITFISQNGFSEDLSALSEGNARLNISLKLGSSITQPVYLSMNCESEGDVKGSCFAQQDIQPLLHKLPQGEWKNITVSGQCFIKQGIQLSKILIPFKLEASSAINLSISDIHFAMNSETEADIQCP